MTKSDRKTINTSRPTILWSTILWTVFGENFTDRKAETKHLKMNFEAGVNTILISPRRTGKTSLVYKAVEQITDPSIKIVMMDIYDCRDEYEFYERFASAVLKGLATVR